jgi:hypothetical protein
MSIGSGSTNAHRRKPKSCFSRVFNIKLGCFVMSEIAWRTQARPYLELKSQPRLNPVSFSLTRAQCYKPFYGL